MIVTTYKPSTVEDACSEFRDLINSITHEREKLLDAMKNWLVVCSSMDVIDDTELAIKSYEEIEGKIDEGRAYLSIYGLLQAMYVQQDAINNIRKTLNTPSFNKEEEEKLKYIREIRNDAVGHPTKRDHRDVDHRASFLHRFDMSLGSFTLQRSHFDRALGDEMVEVKPFDLIKEQREIITKFLNFVISSLKDRVNKHRAKFMDNKLRDCFPDTINYCISKIYEADTDGKFQFAAINFKTVKESVDKFIDGLKARQIETGLQGVELVLEELKRPFEVLGDYFSGKIELERGDLDIYTYYLHGKIKELIEMSVEIDTDYAERLK